MDLDTILIGTNLIQALEAVLDRCCAMVVVIGDKWMTLADSDGKRRLDASDDFVRLEIEMALRRSIPIIPVLVDGAPMPRMSELPESIRPLTAHRACDIRNIRFRSDCAKLFSMLDGILSTKSS